MLIELYKLTIKTIRHGLEDISIKQEYSTTNKKTSKSKLIHFILSLTFCIVLCVVFVFSLFVNRSTTSLSETIPSIRVVRTGSMSKKHQSNWYLFTNDLNDQIQTFDLIFTYKAPKEEQIELYDIVVYETDDIFIVHRIVGIEEPNSSHPDERWFLLQGDANNVSDRFPVKYDQIRGIYRGEKIPFIGSFILFMQSPAGWLCILLVVAAMIITPVFERKYYNEKYKRYLIICNEQGEMDSINQTASEIVNSPFAHLKGKRDDRTFDQKIKTLPIARARFKELTKFMKGFDGVRLIESKKSKTYKKGNVPIVRYKLRGKTLNAYIGLNPMEYIDSKYIFTDVSNVKAYAKYPMRIKVSSERQVKMVKELISVTMKEKEL